MYFTNQFACFSFVTMLQHYVTHLGTNVSSRQEQEEAMQQLRDAIRQLYDARQRQVKAKAAEKQILEAQTWTKYDQTLDGMWCCWWKKSGNNHLEMMG